ncbi:MAG TPA: glycosyltransferase [Solirubrobacteraceae bacterium]
MRVLIFHGYLLSGTGSNVYNARLVEALTRMGHEVHILAQERHPDEHAFLTAAGDWEQGTLRVRTLREAAPGSAGATLYRPDIGGLLPVYVADRYEGIEARTFAECSDEEVERYIAANVVAVREVTALARPEIALANHLVMGPVILSRALGAELRYAVKVHGSALEYTVKPQPQRFLAPAREGALGAAGILVGSLHTASSLWEALQEPQVRERTRLGPPGVDVQRFVPRERSEAIAQMRALAERLQADRGKGAGVPGGAGVASPPAAAEPVSAFQRDAAAAGRALARIDPERDRLVAFVGKLIVSKGIDLLIASWPLVLEQVPQARLVVVGFGAYREGAERLIALLGAGDLAGVEALARAGRDLEREHMGAEGGDGGEDGRADGGGAAAQPLRHLLAFVAALSGDQRERYLREAQRLPERIVLTGRLEHEELAELLPACEALVAPSTFPEAFGMVAAEAAACGALPVVAAHSGLAEVSAALARSIPPQAAECLSFPVDDHAVQALAERLVGWLTIDQELRERTRSGLVAEVRRSWSWQGVARGVIAAAQGELDELSVP